MSKPSLYLVDLQNHFKTSPTGEFDNSHDFSDIVKNLEKSFRNYGDIVIIADMHHIHEVDSGELHYNFEMEYMDYFDDYDDFAEFVSRNSRLIDLNIDFGLMKTLDTLVQNNEMAEIKIYEKEFGSLRGMMDCYLDNMFYIMELKKLLGDMDMEDALQEGNKEIQSILDHLEDEQGLDLSEVEDLLYNGEFDNAEYAGADYASYITHEKEIVMGGGGAMECLLEEFIQIKVGTNIPKVTVDTSLVYGEKHSIERAIDTVEEQLSNLDGIKKELMNSKACVKTK